MTAPSPSRRPVASPTDHAAANDDTEPITGTQGKGSYSAVNPLWMITAALALFLAAMAILISS